MLCPGKYAFTLWSVQSPPAKPTCSGFHELFSVSKPSPSCLNLQMPSASACAKGHLHYWYHLTQLNKCLVFFLTDTGMMCFSSQAWCFFSDTCFSQNYNVKMNVVLLPGFCVNFVDFLFHQLFSFFTLTWVQEIRYQWSMFLFCFWLEYHRSGTIEVHFFVCFWGGYIRDYQWGASFVSDVDTEDATGEVHFLVSDLDTTDQKPWSVFVCCVFCLFPTWIRQISYHGVFLLLLSWIQQICTKWGTFSVVSDLDTTPVTSEVLFSFFWLGYNGSVPMTYICCCFWLGYKGSVPMTYICCCFWLGYNGSVTNEVDILLLFLTWIQQIQYQWGTFFVVSALDTTDLLPMRYIFCCCFWLGYNRPVTSGVKKYFVISVSDGHLLFLMDWSCCAYTASSVHISEVKLFQHCCHCWNLHY